MSAHDCFTIGLMAYSIEDHYHTDLWFQEALRRIESEEVPSMPKVELLEYMSFELFRQGSPTLALELIDQILKIDPRHEAALTNSDAFLAELLKRNETENVKGDDGSDDIPVARYHVTVGLWFD